MNGERTIGTRVVAGPEDLSAGAASRAPPWRIAVVGLFIVMVVIAFARLAFGMLLPEMQMSLGLSYRQGGYLAAATSLGYLLAVLPSGVVAARWGERNTIVFGMLLVASGFAGLALSTHHPLLLALMAMLGTGTALAQVSQVTLVAAWFAERRGTAIGITTSGAGLGLLIIGLAVPFLTERYGGNGWRLTWAAFAVLSVLVLALTLVFIKDPPSRDRGNRRRSHMRYVYRNPRVIRVAVLYGIVGMTYIVQSVFMVSFMQAAGISPHLAGLLVAIFGILGIFAGPLWGRLSDRVGRGRALMLCFWIVITATALPVINSGTYTFALHYLLAGCTLGGLFALTQAATTEQVAGAEVPIAFGFANTFFAAGQFVGPVVGGWLIDLTGGFRLVFSLTVLLMLFGAFLASRIPRSRAIAS